MPAAKARMEGRGRIEEGFWADLVVVDPVNVGDRATFQGPRKYPEEISHVLVNGEFVVKEGAGLRPGKNVKRR